MSQTAPSTSQSPWERARSADEFLRSLFDSCISVAGNYSRHWSIDIDGDRVVVTLKSPDARKHLPGLIKLYALPVTVVERRGGE